MSEALGVRQEYQGKVKFPRTKVTGPKMVAVQTILTGSTQRKVGDYSCKTLASGVDSPPPVCHKDFMVKVKVTGSRSKEAVSHKYVNAHILPSANQHPKCGDCSFNCLATGAPQEFQSQGPSFKVEGRKIYKI